MRVLIGCEFSGIVREAFAARGHNAWSCDLLPTEISGQHFVQDVFKVINEGGPWDLGIFHPPCTYILNSGCKHLYQGGRRYDPAGHENARNPDRWKKMIDGAEFFWKLLNCGIKRIAIENPIMVGYAQRIVGRKWDQKIQPWQFGHPESKATCLWLKNLPPLKPAENVYEEMMKLPRSKRERIHFMSSSVNRNHERSRSYPGIAKAMAEQWG